MSYLMTGDIPDELRDAILEKLRTNTWTAVESLPGSVKIEFGEPPMATGGPIGGPVPYLVGERGPEIVMPVSSSGQTINLTIDGSNFIKWLVDYSNDTGGLPIHIRPQP